MLHRTGGRGKGSCGVDLAVGGCDWGQQGLRRADSVRGREWGGSEGTSSPRAGRVGAGLVRRKGFLLPCGASGGWVGSNFPCGTSMADMFLSSFLFWRAGLPKAPTSGCTCLLDVRALARPYNNTVVCLDFYILTYS